MDVAVERCVELGRGQVGELIDALLPAAAAQVVAPDFPQGPDEDSEAVRLLLGVLVDLYGVEICFKSMTSIKNVNEEDNICRCTFPNFFWKASNSAWSLFETAAAARANVARRTAMCSFIAAVGRTNRFTDFIQLN